VRWNVLKTMLETYAVKEARNAFKQWRFGAHIQKWKTFIRLLWNGEWAVERRYQYHWRYSLQLTCRMWIFKWYNHWLLKNKNYIKSWRDLPRVLFGEQRIPHWCT
jgi:hypothetical protein